MEGLTIVASPCALSHRKLRRYWVPSLTPTAFVPNVVISNSSSPCLLLYDPPKIDVMYLYTQGGKGLLGGICDAQMQTTLATALATSNDATTNSDIDLTFSLVYVGQVRLVLCVVCIYSGS